MHCKIIISICLILMQLKCIAWPEYYSSDCSDTGKKESVTFDFDDKRFNSRLFLTLSYTKKYIDPENPTAGWYDNKQRSRYIVHCEEEPCFQIITPTRWWEEAGFDLNDFENYIPKVVGEHYWNHPNYGVTHRSSKAESCITMWGAQDWGDPTKEK